MFYIRLKELLMEIGIIIFVVFLLVMVWIVAYHRGWQDGAKEVHRRCMDNLDYINEQWPIDWFKIYTMVNWVKPIRTIPMPERKKKEKQNEKWNNGIQFDSC